MIYYQRLLEYFFFFELIRLFSVSISAQYFMSSIFSKEKWLAEMMSHMLFWRNLIYRYWNNEYVICAYYNDNIRQMFITSKGY